MAIFKSMAEFDKIANELDPNDPIRDHLFDMLLIEASIVYETPCFGCGVGIGRDEQSFVWPLPTGEDYIVMDLKCFSRFIEAGKRFIAGTNGEA